MKPIVLGAAAMSVTTVSASTFVVSLGSCTDASKKTPFELSAGVDTLLPTNGGPFCSVNVNSVSSDLVQDTAQCLIFTANAETPIAVASSLGGPYTGSVPLTSVLCSANSAAQPSVGSPPELRRLDAAEPTHINPHEKRQREGLPNPTIAIPDRLARARHAVRQVNDDSTGPTSKPQKREDLPISGYGIGYVPHVGPGRRRLDAAEPTSIDPHAKRQDEAPPIPTFGVGYLPHVGHAVRSAGDDPKDTNGAGARDTTLDRRRQAPVTPSLPPEGPPTPIATPTPTPAVPVENQKRQVIVTPSGPAYPARLKRVNPTARPGNDDGSYQKREPGNPAAKGKREAEPEAPEGVLIRVVDGEEEEDLERREPEPQWVDAAGSSVPELLGVWVVGVAAIVGVAVML